MGLGVGAGVGVGAAYERLSESRRLEELGIGQPEPEVCEVGPVRTVLEFRGGAGVDFFALAALRSNPGEEGRLVLLLLFDELLELKLERLLELLLERLLEKLLRRDEEYERLPLPYVAASRIPDVTNIAAAIQIMTEEKGCLFNSFLRVHSTPEFVVIHNFMQDCGREPCPRPPHRMKEFITLRSVFSQTLPYRIRSGHELMQAQKECRRRTFHSA